ncbi:ADP-heptose:LPS heptosyltransferase [Thermanaerovibrio velox DSM 12556]|uniref:ADP-heptose:LPS heptosyltransferase n=1 Tax=Thermanaerovibrio velox DSM 12556 TaxID=926567 RepID=H0UN27_9BACT|nr:glycosyltransferase family 9 protein [Thermanaerovibrio velox]EHM09306.1 ADP-heptose:LPS heptosyltransferase [Thermanaerovibrio velox DSM 12556]
MRIDPSKVNRVLVIGLSCLGDMLLASAALWNLRLFLPGRDFRILVGPRALEAVKEDPMWDQVVVYDRPKDFPGLRGRIKFISHMRSFSPDLVVDLRSGLNPLFSGAKYAPLWGLRELLLHRDLHEAERNLWCMSTLGVPLVTRGMRFHVTPDAQGKAEEVLAGRLPLAVINPGASSKFNRWPGERFLEVAKWLAREGYFVGVIGKAPDERPIGEGILSILGDRGIDMRSLPSLGVLGAMLKRASIFISNDTGPLHLASAVGTPTVGIYAGRSLARRYGPWCNRHVCVLPPGSPQALTTGAGLRPSRPSRWRR